MINPETILVRTLAGSALLQTSDSDLSRTERLLLIMVNGQVSVGDISSKLYSIPLRRLIEALDYLTGRGLISQDVTKTTAPTALKRHELEAFLRTEELDPTTAMIANFELQAALNDSAHASVIIDKSQNKASSFVDQKIQDKLSKSLPTDLKPAPAAVSANPSANLNPKPVASQAPKPFATLADQPTIQRSAPIRKQAIQKKQSSMLFVLLCLFAVVWFGIIWYVRHR